MLHKHKELYEGNKKTVASPGENEVDNDGDEVPTGSEYVETEADVVFFQPASQAEKGVDPLPQPKEEATLTKETFRQMLDDVLSEKQSEEERKAAAKAAVEASEEAKKATAAASANTEKIEQICTGVDCIKDAVAKMQEALNGFADQMSSKPEVVAEQVSPEEALPAPAQAYEVPVRAEPAEEEHHHHEAPEHLVSTEMALAVLDRILACDHCSQSMKEAMKLRWAETFGREIPGDKDPDSRGDGQPTERPAQADADGAGTAAGTEEPDQVGPVTEEKAAEEAEEKATEEGKPEAGEPTEATDGAGDAPEPTETDGDAVADQPAAAADGQSPDGGNRGFDDPLGFI